MMALEAAVAEINFTQIIELHSSATCELSHLTDLIKTGNKLDDFTTYTAEINEFLLSHIVKDFVGSLVGADFSYSGK